jgi:glycosyltransferase involved in cell wall biosynthesis
VLAILTTHPIQYQVPLWKALSARGKVPFRVFYMSDLGLKRGFDPGFRRKIVWDIDLLAGYDHEFLDVRASASQDSFLWLRLKPNFGERLRHWGVRALWIQGWQVAAYWQAVWEARRVGVEIWLRGETNLRSSGEGLVQAMKRAVLKRLLGRVDWFLYIGEANRQFYLSQGIRPDRMIPAPYCVDNARFAEQVARLRSDRRALRRQWRIPDEAFCFLFVGKLIPKKRPSDLVAAVRGLQRNGAPVHILFVGAGELDDQLRQSCSIAFDAKGSSLGGGEGPPVSFAGFLNQTEISQAYVAADCLVLPSEASETWGLVINEAMASGLPCVTSDACGCVEDLIRPIHPGLSHPVGNIARLKQCLQEVMADPPPSGLLESHIDNYHLLRTVEAVEQLYAKTVGQNAGGRSRLANGI